MPAPPYLTRQQAADYIRERLGVPMTADILARRASDGDGPRYFFWGIKRSGHGGRGRWAVYHPADLDAWIATQFYDPSSPPLSQAV